MRTNVISSAVIACVGLSASVANADVVLVSMRYDSLAGSYSTATQEFRARAADSAMLRSTGAVSRLVSPAGTATFQAGFVSGGDPADFDIRIPSIPTGNPNVRLGVNGLFVATDVNGDTISGRVDGRWVNGGPGFIFFNGTLTEVVVTPAGGDVANSTFDGSAAGAWGFDLPAASPYEGAIVQLVFGAPSFFTADFADRATGVTAQLIPSTGALALLGVGGLVMGRRRR
ncbi:MAG: hypothetical protein SFY69_12020 [Planctomycetota bacterium]|nr:hypothetical protein [Planctomycetota bacterium]